MAERNGGQGVADMWLGVPVGVWKGGMGTSRGGSGDGGEMGAGGME